MHGSVIKLLGKVKQLWMATDSLKAFTDWPDNLVARNSEPSPLVHVAQQATFHVNWQFRFI